MKPELDDDDFDQRPTVPRPVPSPLLLELSNDDFERGWVGRRPSFRSLPPEPVVAAPPAPKPRLSPVVWIPMVFAFCGFGALMLTRSLPTTVPTPAAKMPALIETPVEKPAPEVQKPVAPQESKPEVAKSEPVVAPVVPVVVETKPETTKIVLQPIAAVSKPIAQPEKVALAPKPIAQPESAPKPAAAKPEAVARDEPAEPSAPEPPTDPNGGVVNSGF